MLSIIVPCHNEAEVLPLLYDRVTEAAAAWSRPWEVLLIDDGSTDDTWEQIKRCHGRHPRWKGVRLARNFGQQGAITAGLQQARGDAIVIMDADLQDPPEMIEQFLQHWKQGAHVVYGVRTQRPERWWKRACYHFFYRVAGSGTEMPMPHDAGDFCLIDRRVVRVLRTFREARPFWRGLRAWCGFKQVGVPYARDTRQAGHSQYSWGKLWRLAFDGFWAMTDLPLRWMGQVLTLLFLLIMTCCVIWVMNPSPIWVSTALAGLAGMQVLTALVLGQSQRRLMAELRRRPRFVVSACIGFKNRVRSLPGLVEIISSAA